MKKKNGSTVVKFPNTTAQLERQTEAILFAADEPLDIESIKEKLKTRADIKKTQGLAKTKEDLARIEKEMRTLARDYSKAEGIEKEKLLNILRDKTKIKKELVKLLDRV